MNKNNNDNSLPINNTQQKRLNTSFRDRANKDQKKSIGEGRFSMSKDVQNLGMTIDFKNMNNND
tara:strand:+ start:170 stop:361 length:192 start_codon:yes stop_codon:yes gene_type:complete